MRPIFIDVDGTLRNSQKEITETTLEALRLATQNHYEPILCTGRSRSHALELCKPLKSKFLIYNSGAGIYDCQSQSILHEDAMATSGIILLYDLLQREDVNFTLAYDGASHHYSLGARTLYEPLNIATLQQILSTVKIQQAVVGSSDFDFMRALRNKINQIPYLRTSNQSKCLIDDTIPPADPTFYYDIVDINTSKGNAIKKFCELLHISPQDCIAIGDDENDISMFHVCGYSVAMENAIPAVKSIANYITIDNDHDGVAFYIKQKLLA